MGSTSLMIFCIIFLSLESVTLYSLETSVSPSFNQYDSTISVMSVSPPPTPNFDGSPLAFVSNAVEATMYGIAVSIYVIQMGVSLLSFPFMVASKILIFNSKYPFLLMINGAVIAFLAFAVIGRVTGSGD